MPSRSSRDQLPKCADESRLLISDLYTKLLLKLGILVSSLLFLLVVTFYQLWVWLHLWMGGSLLWMHRGCAITATWAALGWKKRDLVDMYRLQTMPYRWTHSSVFKHTQRCSFLLCPLILRFISISYFYFAYCGCFCFF